MKAVLIFALFLIFSFSVIESELIYEEESELLMNFDNNMLPLIISSHSSDETSKYSISTDHHHHYPKYPKHPKYPNHPKHPKHPGFKRAYVTFPSPPDIAKGAIVFWETCKNETLIFGQFSKGFVEGEEKDYSFKIYKNDQVIVNLKHKDDSLDRIFKINPNGSTEPFLFTFNGTLLSTEGIIGDDFVIGKPDALIGKDKIRPLVCF
ncbi:hypothetical protein C1645_792209 [Glomus cerebriforme]|uniref:Uncharacterized protein n=1 Tax=Glomus cerebriforme TaxID=658196 RepID=A0A397SD05_9GLOM|nr:hypothetical protein C1645_792209 [Glomus cerebriforme]